MAEQSVAQTVGTRVGQAMVRDVIADGMPREWTGLDAQDADQLTAAGIEPGSADWSQAIRAARDAFARRVTA